MQNEFRQFDYDKMANLTNELIEIIKNGVSSENLVVFLQKIMSSKEFFNGQAAEAFRERAAIAVNSYDETDIESLAELINVAQIPRNNAEYMQIFDKVISNQVHNIFRK